MFFHASLISIPCAHAACTSGPVAGGVACMPLTLAVMIADVMSFNDMAFIFGISGGGTVASAGSTVASAGSVAGWRNSAAVCGGGTIASAGSIAGRSLV